ncbi:MAG: protein kinase domain-containing protein [Myxococcota bacterium]
MRSLPEQIGPYEIVELLGDGGTGVVMRGSHRASGALAAIKTPKRPIVEDCVVLRREIGVLQRLSRTGIRGVVEILEHGEQDGVPWYAMELIPGHSLSFWLQSLWRGRDFTSRVNAGDTLDLAGLAISSQTDTAALERSPDLPTPALPPAGAGQIERVLQLSLRIAETVAQLQSEGVVHGDVTPRNILLRDEGDPAFIDFGTALIADVSEPYRESSIGFDRIRGTPGYLAPETLAGEVPDARSDLYSLGVILYELLAGTPPFAAASVQDILRRQTSGTATPLSNLVTGVPLALERIVAQLLVPDPASRIAHVDEVCHAICASLQRPPQLLRRLSSHRMLLRTRVFGRSETLDLIDRRLAEARAGRGGLIVVSGASGLGKTRLLREVRRRTTASGVQILTAEGNPSLKLEGNTEVKAAGFTLLEPVLRAVAGEETATILNEPTQGVALRSAFVALKRAADTTPVLLLLDDIDDADELSVAFLQRYGKDLAAISVLVVATVTANQDGHHALLTDVATRVTLSPLSHGESRGMVKDLLGTQVLPDGVLEFLQEHAGGNPFFLAEYVRAAVSRGILTRQAQTWTFAVPNGAAGAGLGLPPSIEGLFDLRLGYLSALARQAAMKASVYIRPFHVAAFRAITGTGANAADILEELVARDVLNGSADGRYRFAHEKLRELLESSLARAERATLHRHVAVREESLEDTSGADKAVLGYHWAKAGESARALDYLEAAAQEAVAQHAPERAAELLRIAVAHCAELDESQHKHELRARLEEAFADVLLKRARHSEAREHLDAVLTSGLRLAPLHRARVLRKHAASCCTLHEYSRAAELSDQAERALELDTLDPGEDVYRELIQIRLGRFDQLYFSGKLGADLDRLVDELAPLIEAHGTADQACTYYFMATSHAFLRSRYAFDERALALAENGLRSAMTSMADRRGMAEFILGGALLLGSREQCTRALGHFEHAATFATRSGDATLVSRVRTYQAVTRLRLGDVEGVAAAAHLALEAAETAKLWPYVAAAEACHGWVAWRRGDVNAAATLLRAARARWKVHPHRFPFSNLAIFPLLDITSLTDDFETAQALLQDLVDGLPAMSEALTAATRAALDAIQQGEPRAASKSLGTLLRLARDCGLA